MAAGTQIAGQLNAEERAILTRAVLESPTPPAVVLEVGTWLGGGSTIHLLQALDQTGQGHLWGIEADRTIYDQMLANLRQAAPQALPRFTAMFGFSIDVIPSWLKTLGTNSRVDLAFLDGGNNPSEQIHEFHMLDPHLPVGGQLFAHDAKMRKGKWLVPYLSRLDNWQVKVHEISAVGLLEARKLAEQPSAASWRSAAIELLKRRCNPIEIAAAILPSSVCGFALGLMPSRLARRLSDGCK